MIEYCVYLVTDAPDRYPKGLLAGVEAALTGGVSVVQYRATTGSRREHYETALALRKLAGSYGVPLLINDAVDLALAVDADGVHIGQHDLPPATVRRLIGPEKLLGLSITDEVQLARVPSSVDYLGVGPVFATPTKADAAPPLGLATLKRICGAARVPVVAIGGINLGNAREIFGTGVDGVAVVSALSQAGDPAAVVAGFRGAKT